MVKVILLDPEKVQTIPGYSEFDPAVIWKNTIFPLHKGAERAFRELGFMK